jgi:uncharacterized protein
MIHIYPEMKSSCIITPEFIAVIRQQFKLDWSGIHGAPHWARVRDNGLRLAEQTGARSDVIELFAFLHDTQRENDYHDPKHGRRAADFAKRLQGSLFTLNDEGLDLLCFACIGHSDGVLEADITVQTCWDSDRLDLGRVGVIPDPSKLCTAAARDQKMIEWASRNHVAHHKDITRK